VEKEPHSTFPFINIRFYSTIISWIPNHA
jgi:hypothetical protein